MKVIIQNYPIEIPNEPPNETIDGYGLPITEQYWRKPYELTDDEFLGLPVEDRNAIVDRETERRVFGYWFFNKGRPFTFTGDNYFFLTYWTIDGKEPAIYNKTKGKSFTLTTL